MATRISAATGNFSAAGTWNSTDSGGDQLTGNNSVTVGTTVAYSNNFTAGAVTCNGVMLQVASIAGSPSGTMTVTLRNITGGIDVATVTCNISDLHADGNGWYCFTWTGVLLLAATSYAVGVLTSAASQVTLFTSDGGSNWNTAYRTTTTGAPAASDRLFVLGEITGAGTNNTYTVTMDNNSTTLFGATDVGKFATFQWSTSANTEFRTANATVLNVWGGGTLNIGTSGTPVPSGATALLTLGSTTAVSSGMVCNSGFTLNAYGATIGTVQTLLTSDAASGQAVINVGAATNWAANDLITVAGTATSSRQSENMTVSSIATLAATLTANLANTHNGTNSGGFDTRAEVLHFTRNVKIQGTNTTSATSIYVNVAGASGNFTAQYAEFINLGSATGNKRGLDFVGSGGTHSVTYCSFREAGNTASNTSMVTDERTGGTLTFSNNNIRGAGVSSIRGLLFNGPTGGTLAADSNYIICNNTQSIGISMSGPTTRTITNSHISDCATGISVFNVLGVAIDLSNTVCHSCSTAALTLASTNTNSGTVQPAITANPITLWGGATNLLQSGTSNVKLTNLLSFGSLTQNVNISNSSDNIVFVTPTFDPGPSRTGGPTPDILWINTTGSSNITIIGGSAGATTAFQNNFSIGSAGGLLTVKAHNSNIVDSSSAFVSGQAYMSVNSQIAMEHKGAAGTNKTYLRNGIISRDTANKDTGFTSCTALSPTSGNAMTSGESLFIKYYFPVASGAGKTVTVRMKKDGSYNGANPKFTINFLGATITGPTAQSITTSYADYTIVAANGDITEDGAIEVVIDCDGSAGNIYVQTVK